MSRDANRYKTILTKWRQELLRNKGIKSVGDWPETIGKGIKLLTPVEQVGESARYLGKSKRSIKRGWETAVKVGDDDLDEVNRKRRDHSIEALTHLYQLHQKQQKSLAEATRPGESMPRLEPPKQATG